MTVSWDVSDPESGIASSSGCDPTTISDDTAGITLTCSATNGARLSNSGSVTIKRDATAPNAPTGNVNPSPNAAGWNNSVPVTVSFTPNGDNGPSGVAGCTDDVSLNSETTTAGTAVSGTCADNAGNISDVTTVTVKIDTTPPNLTPSVSPNPVLLNGSAMATANATDNLSGVVSQSCNLVDTSIVGSHSVECSAMDAAGNPNSVSVSYSVVYAFSGFFQPIPNRDTTKAGSTIPVKFNLTDANGVSIGTAVANVYANGSLQGTARYDATAQQYIFNLKTVKGATGQLIISVALDDGTSQSVEVTLK